MSSTLLGVKDAVHAAASSLFSSTALVTFGHPGFDPGLPDNIIAVLGARSSVDSATMGLPRRATDELVEVDVLISCFVGTHEQRDATATASGYLDSLTDYCATSATTQLGGVALWSLVTSWELAETDSIDEMTEGRIAEVLCTITARCRR